MKMACVSASRAARDSLDLHDEPGSVLRKSGVGPGFRLSLRGFVPRRVGKGAERRAHAVFSSRLYRVGFASLSTTLQKMKEAERRQTPGNTAASCDAARALLERARLTAFHHGSHLRESFHPKGSASGQASWDAV
jgi:hypothetical protein